MCVVCVTVAGTLIAASQLTPVQVLSDFTTSQKTLTSFSGTSAALSSGNKEPGRWIPSSRVSRVHRFGDKELNQIGIKFRKESSQSGL
jgi:hypothetical protein